jgi:hypothetical protein
MKLWNGRNIKAGSRSLVAGAVMAAAFIGGFALTAPRAKSQGVSSKGQLAEQAFKNVQVLKGTTVDDFMGTMGIMSAAVGFDCSECHLGAGTDKVDWAADTQKKVIARKMVTMVANINKENFSGRQMVTCWSCHHGRDKPATTPQLEAVYGMGSTEMDDVLTQMPGMESAQNIIDKYITAIGGAQKWAAIKTIYATGASIGFGGFGGGGQVELFSKFPDQHTTWIKFKDAPGRGDEVRAYNGKVGWIKTPLAVLTDYELTGGELDGARIDALLSFPQQMKTALTNLKVSLPISISDLPGPSSQTSNEKAAAAAGLGKDLLVDVVQGSGSRTAFATLYFDHKTGLLARMVRYSRTPIGRVPVQIDYTDYREVAGVKMPFHLTFAWLDGRDAIQLSDVKVNVPIDDAKFGHPK